MNISEQAIEIAAQADYEFEFREDDDILPWYEAPEWVRQESRDRARNLLEAAAPYLRETN